MRTRVRATGLVAAILGLLSVAACQPLPQPVALMVTSTTGGADIVPGDGICETTAGVGDCTLQAAIDEGNALGRARITVPTGSYHSPSTLAVTGLIELRHSGVGRALVDQTFTIDEGASLSLDRIDSYNVPGARFSVNGTLVIRHSTITGLEALDVVSIAPGGTVVIENSLVARVFGPLPAITNHGTLVMRNTSLRSWSSLGVATTALTNSGRVVSASSILQSCSGTAPESLGYNSDDDGSCGLAGPGDQPNAQPAFTLSITDAVDYVLNAGSPLIDAIPVGTNGCGTEVTDDLAGVIRPQDGDGDGFAACDVGARETPAAPQSPA